MLTTASFCTRQLNFRKVLGLGRFIFLCMSFSNVLNSEEIEDYEERKV